MPAGDAVIISLAVAPSQLSIAQIHAQALLRPPQTLTQLASQSSEAPLRLAHCTLLVGQVQVGS